MRAAALLILFPLLGRCAALAPDALAAFGQPGVPVALHAKVEHGVPLTLADVVTLSRAGVQESALVDYLYSFGGYFHLTGADVWRLRNAGVSADLIDYMTGPDAHPFRFGF